MILSSLISVEPGKIFQNFQNFENLGIVAVLTTFILSQNGSMMNELTAIFV